MPAISEPDAHSRSALARALGAPLRFLVALAIIARDLVAWAGGPLWRWIAGLRPLQLLARWVATLQPWGVLLALAAPLAVAEPLKIAGLYLIAIERFKLGVAVEILGHALSILLVERIVRAGLPQLLTYRWFAWGWGWFEAVRAAVMEWPVVRATRAAARDVALRARKIAAGARKVVHDFRLSLARRWRI